MTLILTFLILFPLTANREKATAESFDFWVGKWNLTWDDGDGKIGTGTNEIVRVLDGKVIQENFEAKTGNLKGFIGKSWSVFNPNSGDWKQTWVDNQGAYLDFYGVFEDGKKIFQREAKDQQGNDITQRMVFYDIKHDGFTWDWESSKDNGQTWTLQWRISYKRVQ